MLLLVAVAFGQEIPWEACPVVATAADASPYRDTDGGLGDAYSALLDLVAAYVPSDCAWVETTWEDRMSDSWGTDGERLCSGEGFSTTSTSWSESVYDSSMGRTSTTGGTSHVAEVLAGESWTRIELSTSFSSSHFSVSSSRAASWTGAVTGLPGDGSFYAEESTSWFWEYAAERRTVRTPGCEIRWSIESDTSTYDIENVTFDEVEVSVYSTDTYGCPDARSIASVDGVTTGLVDREAWVRDYADVDGDGYLPGSCDCDDADATRYDVAIDIPEDGIDQDCDGDDALADADGDGHDNDLFGGTDCDDTDAGTHPGAADPDDGVDQDCDGADDADADRDGFTANGDARDPDCDDTDSSVRPGAPELPDDGVDQDCDGADLTDVDGDGERDLVAGGTDCDDDDAAINLNGIEVECDGVDQDCDGADLCPPAAGEDTAEDTDAAPPADDPGCTGSAAWLLLTPLLGLRRKARR